MSNDEDTRLNEARAEVREALHSAGEFSTAAEALSAQVGRLREYLTGRLGSRRLLVIVGAAALMSALCFNVVDARLRYWCGTSTSAQCFLFREPTDQQIAENSELRDQQFAEIRTQQDKEIAALQFVGLYFDFSLPDNLLTGPEEPFDERLTDKAFLRQLVNEQRAQNAEAEARQQAGG